jgi:vacuolar-type H+-ATPase subunit H
MSNNLYDYLYFDAKEKAFEIEIEARKDFEKRKTELFKQKKKEMDDTHMKKVEAMRTTSCQ